MSATIVEIPLTAPLDVRFQAPGQSNTWDLGPIPNGASRVNSLFEGDEVTTRKGLQWQQSFSGALGKGIFFLPKAGLGTTPSTAYIFGSTFYLNSFPDALPVSVSPTTAMATAVASNVSMLQGGNSYLLNNAGVLSSITDATLLTFSLAPGVACLDGTFYVLNALDGGIYGSKNLNDPTVWDPLNRINAWQTPGSYVGVIQHRQYVLALKSTSTQVFYDAGTAVGSPLGAALQLDLRYGCYSYRTVQEVSGAHIWLATTRAGNLHVILLDNLQPTVISTPSLERYLRRLTSNVNYVGSCSFTMAGHVNYALTFGLDSTSTTFVTLVYDLSSQQWSFWADGTGNGYAFSGAVSDSIFGSGTPLLQTYCDNTSLNGQLFASFESQIAEHPSAGRNEAVPLEITSPLIDGGVLAEKTAMRLDILSDTQNAGELLISWSDDDYQTWSSWRRMALTGGWNSMDDLGTFRRRAFRFRMNSKTPARLQKAQVHLLPGVA